jgi:hypothetical protein
VRRAGIYLRTGTTNQNAETQLRELEAVAARSEWEIVEVYRDAGVRRGKGRDKRPAFNRLIKDAITRKINMIAAWSVDRLRRSLQDLVAMAAASLTICHDIVSICHQSINESGSAQAVSQAPSLTERGQGY